MTRDEAVEMLIEEDRGATERITRDLMEIGVPVDRAHELAKAFGMIEEAQGLIVSLEGEDG